ncbi:ATP-binding cassette domain-containing protein [Acetobacterium tundrae]|uniref:ATP-binding cassette domain-containing protein n=1 Tax=Acetobacterium tundrae TaxID=132932 RepID=A0ABR6WP99_9FIRM|nr:amino acid ABC transporter ATP-binding protein [Acetobacterium tundrae]MBC3798275.1 ATP-binding cassette domain-containing protein [Acetobacterium tundrae]
MITIKGLSKSFGELSVLENINTEIKEGEVISIIGPSGCGKSTFLRCINLLETPTTGEISVDGQNILAKNADVSGLRQKMGMVFQSFNLFSHLMIIENLMLGPVNLLKIPKQQAYDEGMRFLEMVGLKSKVYAFPDELSGGQKQRAAIARTLAMKPQIVLFDEPTSALDPTMVSEVLGVIRKLASNGLTMMIVTHEMKFARDVSSRVFYMDEKGIYEEGSPEQIFDHPQKTKTRAFIKKISAFEYEAAGSGFDLYELNAKIEEFLKKQMFTERQIMNVQLVCEEILLGILLQAFPRAVVSLLVEHSDLNGEVTIQASFDGAVYDLLKAEENTISLAIINTYAKKMLTENSESRNTVTIII